MSFDKVKMYRCVLSLLVLPGMLLSQSAVGHGHDSDHPAGHDLRPHVHVQSASTANDHGHAHGHDGHHHDHDDVSLPDPATGFDCRSKPTDHDADAVYFDIAVAAAAKRTSLEDSFAISLCRIANGPMLVADVWRFPPEHSIIWEHPPPSLIVHCPLYVRHLALLI